MGNSSSTTRFSFIENSRLNFHLICVDPTAIMRQHCSWTPLIGNLPAGPYGTEQALRHRLLSDHDRAKVEAVKFPWRHHCGQVVSRYHRLDLTASTLPPLFFLPRSIDWSKQVEHFGRSLMDSNGISKIENIDIQQVSKLYKSYGGGQGRTCHYFRPY